MHRTRSWLSYSFFIALCSSACADSASLSESIPTDAGASSCSEPDDVSPAQCESEIPLAPARGGYVRLERFVGGDGLERTLALSEIYTGHSGPGRVPNYFYADFPLDRCFQVPIVPAEPTFYDFIDVGEMMRLSGPSTIEMPKTIIFDNIYYRAAGLGGAVVGGATYEVSSTSMTGDLRMPQEPSLTAPAGMNTGRVSFEGAISLHWTPGEADRLFLVMQQGEMGKVCRLQDDGEFVMPEDAALTTPSWGTISLVALNRDLVNMGGRDIELIGVHGRSAEFERTR